MNQTFKLLMILALGAGMFTLNSCSEDPIVDPDPEPSETVCYISSFTQGGVTTDFTYNSDQQVTQSIAGTDTTIFEYTDGKLSTAYDGTTEATFIYDADNIPSRINLKENGIDDGYFIMESSNSNVTKIESHDDEGEVTEVTNIEYDVDGNVESVLLQSWDENANDFVTAFQVTSMTTDGKKNPYATSFALQYANLESPLIFGQSNIVSGQYNLMGQNITITGTHTYNENNYPLTSDLGSVFITNYTYDCK